MNKQLIITVGREYGSEGHIIAERLAEKYGLTLYNRNLLKEVVAQHHIDNNDLEEFDEIKRNKLLSRTVRGFNNSTAHNVAYLQFEHIKKMADEGKSFVVVGRCAETVLSDYDNVISIFILADLEDKITNVMNDHNISRKEAESMRADKDRKRKHYHNSYCTTKWGDARNYDLTINISRLGFEKTFEIVTDYIDARINQ